MPLRDCIAWTRENKGRQTLNRWTIPLEAYNKKKIGRFFFTRRTDGGFASRVEVVRKLREAGEAES